MDRPWLKAGLIGGAALVVINLVGLVPVLSCLSLPLALVVYVVVGVLAASWLPPRREAGPAAGQGALAGLVAGAIGGIAQTLLAPVALALSGGSQALISQLPPESLQVFRDAGLDPQMFFNAGTVAGVTALCCLPVGIVVAAALAALGGLVYAAAKPE